jgi:RNA polymerase sigma factor (sigma-70 family)
LTFLLGVKAKAASIDHPLGKRSDIDTLTDEQANELMNRLINGDESAADELVRGHMLLAIKIAGKYANIRTTRMSDDLMSEACHAMADCCKRIRNHEVEYENVTEFFAGAIHSRCANFVRNDRLLGACHSTKWNAKQRGEEIQDATVVSINVPHTKRTRSTTTDFGSDTESHKMVLPFENRIAVSSDVGYIILRDLLDSCIETNEQRAILDLRIQGHNIRDIADTLGCGRTKVSDELQRIKTAFRAKLDE